MIGDGPAWCALCSSSVVFVRRLMTVVRALLSIAALGAGTLPLSRMGLLLRGDCVSFFAFFTLPVEALDEAEASELSELVEADMVSCSSFMVILDDGEWSGEWTGD